MSRTFLFRATSSLVVFALVALPVRIGVAQSTEITAEQLDALTRAYAELRRAEPELAERSREQIAADAEELLRAHRERARDTTVATVRSAEGSAAVAARCNEGYVTSGRHRASDQAVSIVSEDLRDCDAEGCRAYEVRAVSESTEPFDLDVSVACSS